MGGWVDVSSPSDSGAMQPAVGPVWGRCSGMVLKEGWPATYPTIQRASSAPVASPLLLQSLGGNPNPKFGMFLSDLTFHYFGPHAYHTIVYSGSKNDERQETRVDSKRIFMIARTLVPFI